MSLIASFESGVSTLKAVGGKGLNLLALTEAGFPVPPGFVVTSEAYNAFVDDDGELAQQIEDLDFRDAERLINQCEAIRTYLSNRALPDRVAEAIETALREFGAERRVAFAVRSSSTLEDLSHAAFAGQHDTYLNVSGLAEVLSKTRDCFVSLWGDRAVLYRHHRGFPAQVAQMAVVVQQQIECDRAGVGFSIDPITGRLDRMIFNANFGIGESVVAGECEVDQFSVCKKSLEILDRNIGQKSHMIVACESGVDSSAPPAEQMGVACLSDDEIRETGRLLLRVESHYGWPQDIEWGWKEGDLFLFQSRAVTTFPPRYTRDESAERFPNPMTPLTWDFARDVFRRSLDHSLHLMGLPPLQDDWFSRHNGYIYGNQTAVELLSHFRPIRAKSLDELVSEIPELRERYGWVLELPIHWARDLDRYLLQLGPLRSRSLDELDVGELWQHMLDIQRVASDYFLPNIAISMTQAFLHRMLLNLLRLAMGSEQSLTVFDGLMSGCETKTSVVNDDLWRIAQLAASDTHLQNDLLDQGGRQFLESERLAQYPEFDRRLLRFLEDHGHRELDMDYFQPTWSGQPWVVLDAIALILRSEASSTPRETAREMRQKAADAELHLQTALPQQLRFFFRELVRLARAYTSLDDLEHYQTTRINPIARDAAVAMGHKLVEVGVLQAPEDVFFFRRDELEKLVQSFPPRNGDDHREQVLQAKAEYQTAYTTTPPWEIGGNDSSPEESGGDSLRGLPGSPGRVTGSCFLVRDPGDFARFPAGAILVARTTNPAWTPLFYSATGLITESGGPLSHGAVTAREMKLPAVMSIRGVMTQLKDGQLVTVDGNQGVVLLS